MFNENGDVIGKRSFNENHFDSVSDNIEPPIGQNVASYEGVDFDSVSDNIGPPIGKNVASNDGDDFNSVSDNIDPPIGQIIQSGHECNTPPPKKWRVPFITSTPCSIDEIVDNHPDVSAIENVNTPNSVHFNETEEEEVHR